MSESVLNIQEKKSSCGCGHHDEAADIVLDVRPIPHAIRHATVFGAFGAIPVGGSLVIVAPLAGVIVALTVGVSTSLGTVGLVVMPVIVGAGMAPVPVREMSKAAPTLLSLLAMCKAAVLAPALLALNCTTKSEVAPMAILDAGEVVTVKSGLCVPSMLKLTPASTVLPLLAIVKVFDRVLPTFTLP